MSIYSEPGIPRVFNAAATPTELGGALCRGR
jgi:hypothetical protein